MIRLTDPSRIGPALAEIRELLGISRREAARRIAEVTGRSVTSVNAQMWEWDKNKRKPDLSSLGHLLDVIDFDLALAERPDPDAPRVWPRLIDPPDDVRHVVSGTGTVWTRMEGGGHYWSSRGYEGGVPWTQVLCWGPVTETKKE